VKYGLARQRRVIGRIPARGITKLSGIKIMPPRGDAGNSIYLRLNYQILLITLY
jgi:hypothetical protein